MITKQNKVTLAFVAVLGLLVVGNWYRLDAESEVVLLENGKAAFYRGGTFYRDKFELTYYHGQWQFFRSKPIEAGTLLVPFEGEYNETKDLRLLSNGKVYTVDHKEMTQEELRVVDGQWSYDAGDHWQSIFNLE